MPIKRTGYSTFNRQLWQLKKFAASHRDQIVARTPGWTATETTAFDTLLAAVTAAQLHFPDRSSTP